MKKSLVFIGLISALILGGCGSKKDATKDNFEEAINARFEKKCIEIGRMYKDLPLEIRAKDYEKKSLDNLVKVGLLASKPEKIEIKSMFGNNKRMEDGFVYTLTPEGDKYYQKEDKVFCAGRYEVKEIINFSEPLDVLGRVMTRVKFTKIARDVPSWAEEWAGFSENKNFAMYVAENPIEDSADLVLTNEGWMHHRDFR